MPDASSSPQPPAPGSRYEVPVEGSLALLALGARGLEAWRAKKAEVAQQAASNDTPAPRETPSDD